VAAAPDELLAALLSQASIGVAVLDEDGHYLYVNERLAEINGVPVADHLGRSLRQVIPQLADVVERLHAQVLRTGEPVLDVQIEGSTRGAPDRSWQVSYLPLAIGGQRAVGALLTDTTERDLATAEARRLMHQHAAAADLGQLGLGGAEIEQVLSAACDVLVRELDADLSAVLQFTPERDRLRICAGSGWPDAVIGGTSAELGRRSQAGFTLLEGRPVLSNDVLAETRFQIAGRVLAQGVRSVISIPIPGTDGPLGVLAGYSRRRDSFDMEDASFVRAVANVLGAAIVQDEHARTLEALAEQRGRLVAQALDAGEREQRQVADLLHDDVLQHLLFARQELTDAQDDPQALERAKASVDEATGLLRRAVAGLHPVMLGHAGLAASLDSLASDHGGRAGIEVDVHVEAIAEGHHDRLVVSLVRELLTNVVKHARARRAAVTVATGGGELVIRVADDGRGLPADAFDSALAGGNIGLAAARERVEALGGSTRVGEGLDGRGACIHVCIPIE
jgi:PAS domain S-box-containing protein